LPFAPAFATGFAAAVALGTVYTSGLLFSVASPGFVLATNVIFAPGGIAFTSVS
jgi:hypothetical protein